MSLCEESSCALCLSAQGSGTPLPSESPRLGCSRPLRPNVCLSPVPAVTLPPPVLTPRLCGFSALSCVGLERPVVDRWPCQHQGWEGVCLLPCFDTYHFHFAFVGCPGCAAAVRVQMTYRHAGPTCKLGAVHTQGCAQAQVLKVA